MRYDEVNAMLLNEFLKQRAEFQQERHRNDDAMTEPKTALAQQQEAMAALAARLDDAVPVVAAVGR